MYCPKPSLPCNIRWDCHCKIPSTKCDIVSDRNRFRFVLLSKFSSPISNEILIVFSRKYPVSSRPKLSDIGCIWKSWARGGRVIGWKDHQNLIRDWRWEFWQENEAEWYETLAIGGLGEQSGGNGMSDGRFDERMIIDNRNVTGERRFDCFSSFNVVLGKR
jgi:hypothetical protein